MHPTPTVTSADTAPSAGPTIPTDAPPTETALPTAADSDGPPRSDPPADPATTGGESPGNDLSAPAAVGADAAGAGHAVAAGAPQHAAALRQLPLLFVRNVGQSRPAVRALAQGLGGTLFFTNDEVVLALPVPDARPRTRERNPRAAQPRPRYTKALRIRLLGADPSAMFRMDAPQPGTVNYLLGTAPAQQRTGLTGYGGLVYEEIYPGIELRYDGIDGALKSTYTVAPGASPNAIRWRYQGADDVTLAADGSLQIITRVSLVEDGIRSTRVLTVTEAAPIAWQGAGDGRVAVPVRFVLGANQTVRFAVGAYNLSQPLVIDPTITYSTRIGGNGGDGVSALVVDSTGAVYLAGMTTSADYPISTAPLGNGGGNALFVTKLSPDGQSRLFSTIIGAGHTAADDETWLDDLAIDSTGASYLVGMTTVATFPTLNARQPTRGGGTYDAFLTKLAPDGTSLGFSTYLGGNGDETGATVAVDASGVTVVGTTDSASGFPFANATHTTLRGALDVFISKLTLTGSAFGFSTYLGGAGSDGAVGVALTASGQILVVGSTTSADYPRTANAASAQRAGTFDGFVTLLPASGGAPVYSSYAGITGASGFGPMAFDGANTVILLHGVAGMNPDQEDRLPPNRDQLFVSSLRLDGQPNRFTARITGLEQSSGVARRPDGSLVVVGSLNAPLNPWSSPTDAVALLLDGSTGSLLSGQVLGGSGSEGIADVVVDTAGAVSLGGQTSSPDFVTGALMTGASGTTTTDGFVVKLTFPALTLTASTRRIDYDYDALNRLTSATESGASTASYVYAYDRAGNRTSVTTNSVAQSFSFNTTNEVVGWNYDAVGNLLNDGTRTYTYDALSRMSSHLVGGGRTDYTYNGDGVLVRDARGVTVQTYAQDLAAPLPQVLQINQDSTYYGLDRLATDLVPFYRRWHLHDGLGSTRQTVVGDRTLTAGRYDPWGTPLDNPISPFGFAGELQGDGGLVYLRARWYTPQQGVFTSRDPFAGWAERPYSQHYFQYGYSNPVVFTDPSGRAGIKEAERICPFGTHWDPVIEDCLPNIPVPPPTNPTEPERPRPPRPGIGTLPSVFPAADSRPRNPPRGGTNVGDAAIKAGLCTIATLLGLAALAGALEGVRDAVQPRRDIPVRFYRGVTYYDGLRAQEEGFDAGGILSRRQTGREMAPGLYVSRNRDVAAYFGYVNSDPFLGSPGQGGPALMTITLPQRKFEEIAAKYGVIDNTPVAGLPFDVPEPHVETLFPYASLAELFANSVITIEPLPMP